MCWVAALTVSACSPEPSIVEQSSSPEPAGQSFCEEFLNTTVTVESTGQTHTAELFHCFPNEGIFLRYESGQLVYIRNDVISQILLHEDDVLGIDE
jgi:hypothetical protein